jgi:Beta-lactamase
VLQLVDEGAFALDDEAGPIVGDVTVRQLLNHTSGLPNFDDDLVALFEPYRKNPAHRSELGPRERLALALERRWPVPGLARQYVPADNSMFPGPGPGPVDMTELDLPFTGPARDRLLGLGSHAPLWTRCSAASCFRTTCARRCCAPFRPTGTNQTATASGSAR